MTATRTRYTPDHNGECLHCDEPAEAHDPSGACPVRGTEAEEIHMHMHPDDPRTAADFCRDAVGHGCFAVDLDGQVQGYTPSVRDRLIERGVLRCYADGRWRLHWHGFDLEQERAADMACCDFCSARPVGWLVPCVSFDMPRVPGHPARPKSVGDWAACEACGAAIAARDRAALLRRSLAVPAVQQARLVPGLAQVLTAFRRELHRRFWQAYRGGAVRVVPHPYGH